MKKIIFYSFIALLLFMQTAHAQIETYTLLEPLPCIEGTGTNCKNTPEGVTSINEISLSGYVGYVFKLAIALAVLLAVIMIIWGGFQYMFQDSFTSKNDAKERFRNAAWGLGIALLSYLFLRTIDPRLVHIQTTVPEIKIDTTEAELFNKTLSADLRKLGTEAKQAVVDADKKIATLQARRNELQRQLILGQGDIVAINLELTKIEQEIKALTSSQNQMIGTGQMSGTFKNIIGRITTEQTASGKINEITKVLLTKNSWEDAWKAIPTASKESVDTIKEYKDELGRVYLNTIKNPQIDPALKQALSKEYNFRTRQIDEEFQVYAMTVGYPKVVETFVVNDQIGNSTFQRLEAGLLSTRATYTAALTFLTNSFEVPGPNNTTTNLDISKVIPPTSQTFEDLVIVKKNPELSKEYQAILNDRIRRINESLLKGAELKKK